MMVKSFAHLIELVKKGPKITIAMGGAEDLEELKLVERAEQEGIAEFILLGDKAKINQIAEENSLNIKAEIIGAKSLEDSAAGAVDLVNKGRAQTVMKGMMHSSIFLRSVINKESGLGVGRTMSSLVMFEKGNDQGLWAMSDVGMNIEPDLRAKQHILENAVDMMRKLGYEKPRVACLAAQELVNPAMQDTIDAAILSKMADRGQIKNCYVDGPLAFDIAFSKQAAEEKGIVSDVAGRADIMLVPNITVGNVAIKAIMLTANVDSVASLVGARVPVIFTSRSATVETRLLSVAQVAYSL